MIYLSVFTWTSQVSTARTPWARLQQVSVFTVEGFITPVCLFYTLFWESVFILYLKLNLHDIRMFLKMKVFICIFNLLPNNINTHAEEENLEKPTYCSLSFSYYYRFSFFLKATPPAAFSLQPRHHCWIVGTILCTVFVQRAFQEFQMALQFTTF